MKAKKMLLLSILTAFVMVVVVSGFNTVDAAKGTITNGSSAGNIITGTGAGPKIDHTSCTYAIDDQQAWCIEAGIDVKQGEGYSPSNYDGADSSALSYLMYLSKDGSVDNQIIQAAIWKLTGNSIEQVDKSNDVYLRQVDAVIAQARDAVASGQVSDGSISVDAGDYNFHVEGDKYVTNKINISGANPGITNRGNFGGDVNLVPYNGGYRLEVPIKSAKQSGNVEIGVSGSGEVMVYLPATQWKKAGSQTLVTPNRETRSGNGTNATFYLTVITGSGSIEKVDEYNKPIKGVVFGLYDENHAKIDQKATDDNGKVKFGDLLIGKYYVKELSVPIADMELNETEFSFDITPDNTDPAPIKVENKYYRGSLKLKKIDEHKKKIPGAVFHIEGGPEEEHISADYTTDANGEISLTDLRLGVYTVHEVSVPPTLVLKSNEFNLNVERDSETTYTHENEYERGQLGIQKKDVFADEGKKNYGDGNYKDIVVELHAAEDISEGETQVLEKDELVATRTFKADGTTEIVKEFTRQDGVEFDGLPLGNYYWKEVKTNSSYLMPIDSDVKEAQQVEYPLNITYVDMYTEYVTAKQAVMYDQEVMGKVIVYKHDQLNDNNPDDTTHSDTNPAAGAKLRLTLRSNYNFETQEPIDPTHDTYTATVDNNGKAEFINPEFESLHMEERGMDPKYTIPYGDYVLSEDKTSTVGDVFYYGIQDATVPVEKNHMLTQPIVSDEPIPVFLELRKIDADIDDVNGAEKERVELAGAKFRIWDCNANDWLRLELSDGSANVIEEYVTNEEGHIITPKKIYSGEYVIYEVDAPQGYYLNEKFRLPEGVKVVNGKVTGDVEKLGKPEYGGVKITIDNTAVYVGDAESYPDLGETLDYAYIKDHLTFVYLVEDYTTRGNIDLYKKGEVFTDIKEDTDGKDYSSDGYTDRNPEYTPEYKLEGLAGCKFEVWPVEDVKTADGRLKESAGTKHYIVTGEDGHGICRKDEGKGEEDKLFCNPEGTVYKVHEIECPAGYEPCEDFEVVVKPGDQYTLREITNADANDNYIPIKVKLNKDFIKENEDGVIYSNLSKNSEKAVAIFGLYAQQDLVATNGKEIPADTLIQTVRVVEGEGYVDTYKLPDGDYYLEELYTSEPYTIIDDESGFPHRYDFTVVHKKDYYEEQEVTVDAINDFPKGDLYVLKLSDSDVERTANITVRGSDETNARIREFIDQYTNEMQLQIYSGVIDVNYALSKTLEDFRGDDDFVLLTPAEYGVYLDEKCTQPLQSSKDGGATYEDVKLIPNKNSEGYYNGSYTAKGLPIPKDGKYFVKELVSPVYNDPNNGAQYKYEVEQDPIEVNLVSNNLGDINMENVIFRIFTDKATQYYAQKRDMFTGKAVPNCHFTITDENDNKLLDFVTLEDGEAEIPTDIFEDGKYYYFTELEAPGFPYYDGDTLYELNTEPHKFRVEYDEENDEWKFYGRNQDEYGEEYGEEVENPVIHNFRPRTDIELQKLDMMDSTPVPNCKFRLESKETDFVVEGVTDENGIYLFKDVPYGEYTYTELEAPEEYLIDTTPHDFVHDSYGTKIVVYDERAIDVNTGDIAVMAIAGIALVSVIGIVFLVVKKRASSK